MNHTKLNAGLAPIVIVLIIAAVVGGIFIFKGQGSKESTKTPTVSSEAGATISASPTSITAKTTPVQSNTHTFTTLKEAYNSGKNLKCTINTSAQKFTYYFKDSNIRYDASLTSGTTKIETGQIIKKDVAYTWSNMSSDIVTTTDPKTIALYRSTAFQLDTLLSNPKSNIKLSCAQTTISNSLFEKPKN